MYEVDLGPLRSGEDGYVSVNLHMEVL